MKRENEIRNSLKSMGFKETETNLVFSHKMFEGGLFDLSATDSDIFWIMKTIFTKCEEFGKQTKAEEIRKTLLIFQEMHICETDPNKHKKRDNKFGITWCIRCGKLFTKPSGKPITKQDREKHNFA